MIRTPQQKPFVAKSSKARFAVNLGLVIFFLGVIALGFFISYRSVDSLLWAQRADNLTSLMGGVRHNADLYFDDAFADLDNVGARLEDENFADEGALASELKKIEGERKNSSEHLLVFYASGKYIDCDNHGYVYDDYQSVTSGFTHSLTSADLSGINGSGEESLLYFSKLTTPIVIDGQNLIFLAKQTSTATLESFFEEISPNSQSAFYLMAPDGSRIYHQNVTEGNIFSGFNLLEELKNATYTHDTSYQGLVAGLSARTGGTILLNVNGKDYFVAYAPLSTNSWSLLMSVPSDSVATAVAQNTREVLFSFSLTFVAIVLAGAVVVSLFVYYQHQRELSYDKEQQLLALAEQEKKASAAKSSFLSSMAHDIRTPMNGIIGMLNIAEENPDDPENVKACLSSIEKSSNHLLSLINDVLDMSRIESGKVEMKNDPFNLFAVVDGCLSIIKGELEARDVVFKSDISGIKHPYVRGDKVRLARIITNILGNSVKFTPDGKSISFSIREDAATDDKVTYHFFFADTGIGMSPEFQKKIFEPFSQEERPSSTAYKGTGLGMAITKQYVEAMGGTISLTSELDQGSSFDVILPLPLASAEEVFALNQPPAAIPDLAGKTVLLVEDNDVNVIIAKHLLQETHCTTVVAKDGLEAVKLFTESKEGTFAVILMDIMMPVMNGYDATKAIRSLARPDALGVPIIAMTANAFQEDVDKAKLAGMNDHLTKPIDKDRFFQLLGKYGGDAS